MVVKGTAGWLVQAVEGEEILNLGTFFSPVLGAVVALGLAIPAQAGLMGQTIDLVWDYPCKGCLYNYNNAGLAVVGPGVEYSGYAGGQFQVDFTDTQLIITSNYGNGSTPSGFNGPVFTNETTAWTHVAVDPATTGGFLSSVVSFSGNELFLNMQGNFISQGDRLVLDLAADVPEPASFALMGAGLAGLGFIRRRKRA